MKKLERKWHMHDQLHLSAPILTQWWHPVASSEALDLLHWAMCTVLYQHTATVVKIATFIGVFVDCCLFACYPGGRRGDTKQVVAQWWHP